MNKGLIILIVGIILVIAAVVGIGYLMGQMVKNVKTYSVESHTYYNVTYSLEKSRDYIFVISSNKVIHYEITAPNGTVMAEGNVSDHNNIWLNNTVNGKYTIHLRNDNNDTVKVTIVQMYKKSIQNLAMGVLWLGGVCLIGIILIIVGIIVAILVAKNK